MPRSPSPMQIVGRRSEIGVERAPIGRLLRPKTKTPHCANCPAHVAPGKRLCNRCRKRFRRFDAGGLN